MDVKTIASAIENFKSLLRRLPALGFVLVAPAFMILAALGLWIVTSGVPNVRGIDLNVVYTIKKALAGAPIYTNPAAVPFDITQYSPIYYLAVVDIASLFGVNGENTASVVVLARSLSFACALFLMIGLYAYGRRTLALANVPCLIVAALAFVLTSPWFFLARPDAMAVLFGLASLAVASAAARPISILPLLGSGALAVAAVFTKQNEIQIVAILFLYVMIVDGLEKAMLVLAAALFLGAIVIGLCLWHWPYFIANVIGGLDNGFSFENLINKTLTNFLYPQSALVALAGIAVIAWADEHHDRRKILFRIALPVLFGFAIATGIKTGSAENYFNDFIIVACAGVGLLLCEARNKKPELAFNQLSFARFVGMLLIILMPFWTVSQALHYWKQLVDPSISLVHAQDSLRGSRYRQLQASLDMKSLGSGDYILASSLPLTVALGPSAIVPQKELAVICHERGAVDFTDFRHLVSGGHVRYLVLDNNESIPRSFLGAPLDGFVPQRTVAGFTVFVPGAKK